MHITLKVKPPRTDLFTSWSGRESNPTCPSRLRVRFGAPEDPDDAEEVGTAELRDAGG
jgi:hypothetical protein